MRMRRAIYFNTPIPQYPEKTFPFSLTGITGKIIFPYCINKGINAVKKGRKKPFSLQKVKNAAF